MRKWLALVAILVGAAVTLAACGCTPTPPVKTTTDLDKLITNGLTTQQVYAYMRPALKSTSVLYQADLVELTAKGNWHVVSKPGGYKADETGKFQVIFFQGGAAKHSYAVFFQNDSAIGKAWFTPGNAATVEGILQGKNYETNQKSTATTTAK